MDNDEVLKLFEKTNCDTFEELNYKYTNISNSDDFDDFCKKGFFPYSWFDSINKFDVVEYPPIEPIYNNLNKKHIKLEDYN